MAWSGAEKTRKAGAYCETEADKLTSLMDARQPARQRLTKDARKNNQTPEKRESLLTETRLNQDERKSADQSTELVCIYKKRQLSKTEPEQRDDRYQG